MRERSGVRDCARSSYFWKYNEHVLSLHPLVKYNIESLSPLLFVSLSLPFSVTLLFISSGHFRPSLCPCISLSSILNVPILYYWSTSNGKGSGADTAAQLPYIRVHALCIVTLDPDNFAGGAMNEELIVNRGFSDGSSRRESLFVLNLERGRFPWRMHARGALWTR